MGKNLKEGRVITGPHYLMSATIFWAQSLIKNGTDLLWRGLGYNSSPFATPNSHTPFPCKHAYTHMQTPTLTL